MHNPNAGDAKFSKEALLEKVQRNGVEIHYVSTEDENWEESVCNNEDLIILTGGDGTVRKLATVVLRKRWILHLFLFIWFPKAQQTT